MKEIILIVLKIVLIITLIAGFFIGCFFLKRTVESSLDQAICEVSVEDKVVYTGRCHLLNLTVLDAFADKMAITVFEDIYKLKPKAYYVNHNIKVTTIQKGN